HAFGPYRPAHAARRQVAVDLDARQRHVTGHALRQFHFRRVGRRHVAADALGADGAAHSGHLEAAGDRLQLDRRTGRDADGVVDRYVVVARGPAHVVLGAHVDPSRTVVDGDAHVGELTLIAARPLDGIDGNLVTGAAGDDDA